MTKIAIVIVVTFVLLNMLRLILGFFELAQMFTVMKCLDERLEYQKPLHFNQGIVIAHCILLNMFLKYIQFVLLFATLFQSFKYKYRTRTNKGRGFYSKITFLALNKDFDNFRLLFTAHDVTSVWD